MHYDISAVLENPTAATALATGRQQDEDDEGGDEDAEPENAEQLYILKTIQFRFFYLNHIFSANVNVAAYHDGVPHIIVESRDDLTGVGDGGVVGCHLVDNNAACHTLHPCWDPSQ